MIRYPCKRQVLCSPSFTGGLCQSYQIFSKWMVCLCPAAYPKECGARPDWRRDGPPSGGKNFRLLPISGAFVLPASGASMPRRASKCRPMNSLIRRQIGNFPIGHVMFLSLFAAEYPAPRKPPAGSCPGGGRQFGGCSGGRFHRTGGWWRPPWDCRPGGGR